jgi:hypothetical protein
VKTETLVFLGAGAVVLYVVASGRWNSGFNTPPPTYAPPGSAGYVRPGQPNMPPSPLGQIAGGLGKLWQALGGSLAPSTTEAPADNVSTGVSVSDTIRTNQAGDLVVSPPEILNGGVSGASPDAANPGSFYGIDQTWFNPDSIVAIDPSSSFDAQSAALIFT